MKHYRLFQAWQSTDEEYTGFISKTIREVAKLQKGKGIEIEIVRYPAQDEAGSPDIVEKLWDQIENCDLFVGDISAVSDAGDPNSNVVYEIGIADAVLGERRVILVCSRDTDIEKLPFDINHKRISHLGKDDKSATNKLNEWIEVGIQECDIQQNQRDLIFRDLYDDLYVVYNNLMRMVFSDDESYSDGIEPPTVDRIKEKLSTAIIDELMISVDYSCVINRMSREIQSLYKANHRRGLSDIIRIFNALDRYNWCMHSIEKTVAFEAIQHDYKKTLSEDSKAFRINNAKNVSSYYGSVLFNPKYVYITGQIPMENVFLKEMFSNEILMKCHCQNVKVISGQMSGLSMQNYRMKSDAIDSFSPLIYEVLVSIYNFMDSMNFLPSVDATDIKCKSIICWIKQQ